MKILLVCEYWYGTGGYGYARILRELGHELHIFDYRKPRVTMGGKLPLVSALTRRANNHVMSAEYVKTVENIRPDAVIFLKGEWVTKTAVREAKKRYGHALVQWYPDSPFNVEVKNATKDSIESIPLFDIYYIYAKSLVKPLYDAGAQRVEYLPFCYDPQMLKPPENIQASDRDKYATDLVFAGTWEPMRQWWLERITEFDLSVWGNMWEKVPASNPLRIQWKGEAIYGEEISKLFAVSKIHLNFLREQNKDSNNVRTFEIPGFGGFLLTERSKEQAEELFIEGKEIECFESVDELKEKIRYYLYHENERVEIAKAGHERAVREHQAVHRMQQIISDIESL